jgi:NADPH-dependent curcumin reductase CurA
MEADLRTLVLSGAGVPPRVHWVQRPQGDPLPAVILHRISNVPMYRIDEVDGLVMSRVQADIYGETYAAVKAATRAIETTVSGYAGTVGATVFQLIQIDGERDWYDAGSNDADRFYRVTLDLLVHHRSA